MQETWLNVYSAFGHVRQAVESKAYLRKIAFNRWVDQQRKRRIPSTTLEEYQDVPVLESDSLVLQSLLAKEALGKLAQTLPLRQQAAMLLTEVFGHTAREAAELLSTSEGAVKALLNRARATLTKRRRAEANPSGASQEDGSQIGVRQHRDRPLDKDGGKRLHMEHGHSASAERDWVDGIYRAVVEGDVETVLELTGQSGDAINASQTASVEAALEQAKARNATVQATVTSVMCQASTHNREAVRFTGIKVRTRTARTHSILCLAA